MITQRELAELGRSLHQLSDVECSVKLKKQSIMTRLLNGEEVQRGRIDAVIIDTNSRRFSEAALASLLGPEETARLKSLLPESTSRSLKLLQS